MNPKKSRAGVHLRRRPRRNGTTALYLDYHRDGHRVNEYLKLYRIPENSRADKAKNRKTLKLAEALRVQPR